MTASRPACHDRLCADPARRAHHDRLVLVESDPDAMLELFDLAVTWSELEYPAATMIAPAQWLGFAHRHHWRCPERTVHAFSLATDIALRGRSARQTRHPELVQA